MREIKFRAWLKKEKIMVELSEINFVGEFVSYDAWQFNDHDYDGTATFDDIELMQYVGQKDKNGKEIYEGDIVDIRGYLHIVRYDEEYACFYFTAKDDSYDAVIYDTDIAEVIGNIYGNPDLLEEKNG